MTTTKTTTTVYAIAVIEPLSGDDVGFDWGAGRAHVLLCADSPEELAAAVTDHYGLADYPAPTLAACVEAVRDACGHGEADVAGWSGEAVELLTDWLPSAGSSEAWGDDVWLGVADRLSYEAFRAACQQLGLPATDSYDPPSDAEADACVRANDPDGVESAVGYLRAGDPVRAVLARAVARARS